MNLTEHLVALALLAAARPGGREGIAFGLRAALAIVEDGDAPFALLRLTPSAVRALGELGEILQVAAGHAEFLAEKAGIRVASRP